jgi:hypothetical protein
MSPVEFLKYFGKIKSAKVIYTGKLNGPFIHAVRSGQYGVKEGVVCKGGGGGKDIWMVKIKTDAYLKKLKEVFQDKWRNFWE